MAMHSNNWSDLGKKVVGNVAQKSSAEGALIAAGTTAMAYPDPNVQLGGMIVMALTSLWKIFTNGNKK